MLKNPAMKNTLVNKIYWRCFVLDEGHVIKNVETELAKMCRKVHFQFGLLLTGTPLQNNLTELWGKECKTAQTSFLQPHTYPYHTHSLIPPTNLLALLNFLFPEILETSDAFDEGFNISEKKVNPATLQRAHAMLAPLMIRRLKEHVEQSMPPKVETTISCPLAEYQLFWYRRLLLKDSKLLSRIEAGSAEAAAADQGVKSAAAAEGGEAETATRRAGDYTKLKNLMMQLRKVCNHPFLMPNGEPNPEETTAQDLVEASGKMGVLDRLLLKLKKNGNRVVIFSQFTRTLDIVDDYANMRGWRYTRLDGSTNRVQRNININTFNAPESRLFMFLMTTRAGGLGINLQVRSGQVKAWAA